MEQMSREEGRRQRFELLFDRHRRAVLGYALRRVESPADAADVVAGTFVVAWRRIDEVPDGEAARPWLLGVARRALANERRGHRRRFALAERLGQELVVQTSSPQREGVEDARTSDVWKALAQLSQEDREVLLLAGWEELEPAQIATVLGIRAVTARSRLHRARRRLRAELDAEDARANAPAVVRMDRCSHLELASKEAR